MSVSEHARAAGRGALRLSRGRTLRRLVVGDASRGPVGFLAVLSLACTALVAIFPMFWPVTLLVIPLVLASLWLDPRVLPWFVVFVLAQNAYLASQQEAITPRTVIAIITMFGLGLIVMLTSFRRSRLGVAGSTGESMLIDLRDRIQSHGTLPELPTGWMAESALSSAGGTKFAGDFVVAARTPDGSRLDLAVVDVSGKGTQAGTRSLLLSGAFGGLIGAMTPQEFLPAANEYLLRQGWLEGFATAVHLSLDLRTGAYELRSAGHPPAVQLHAGSGRWVAASASGPALGLLEGMEYDAVRGQMLRGDALLLYTDGLVETAQKEMELGIDKLVGQAERLLRVGFVGGAQRLIDAVGTADDDRALVLVHRD